MWLSHKILLNYPRIYQMYIEEDILFNWVKQTMREPLDIFQHIFLLNHLQKCC